MRALTANPPQSKRSGQVRHAGERGSVLDSGGIQVTRDWRWAIGQTSAMRIQEAPGLLFVPVGVTRLFALVEPSVPRASIIWLARAVDVVRPVAVRLHIDCARFANGGRLGITLGMCTFGLETFAPIGREHPETG